MYNVNLLPQEVVGNYKFNSQVYMTRGFIAEFGDAAAIVVLETMRLIHKRKYSVGADYLQVAECNRIRY